LGVDGEWGRGFVGFDGGAGRHFREAVLGDGGCAGEAEGVDGKVGMVMEGRGSRQGHCQETTLDMLGLN